MNLAPLLHLTEQQYPLAILPGDASGAGKTSGHNSPLTRTRVKNRVLLAGLDQAQEDVEHD